MKKPKKILPSQLWTCRARRHVWDFERYIVIDSIDTDSIGVVHKESGCMKYLLNDDKYVYLGIMPSR